MTLYRSPQEAMQAPPEEFLYLACLHEGTGVERPTSSPSSTPRTAQIVHELPMPNVGDELHHFGWNRCSSACHGPDRSHLIVPGFRSSRVHVVNVADDPRRPTIEKVIEPEELVAQDRLHPPAHRPLHAGRQRRHLDARRRGRQRRRRLRRPRRQDVRGQGPLGERRRAAVASTTTSGTSRARTCSSRASSASRTPTSAASTSRTSRPAATGSGIHFWNLETRTLEQTIDLGEKGLIPLEVALAARPRRRRGLRRRRALERRCGASTAQRLAGRPTR